MSHQAAVLGVGTSSFGKQPEVPLAQLAWSAVQEALSDSGVDARGIEAAYVGSVLGPFGSAQRALQGLGIGRIPVITVENACASGTTAFHEACWAVREGRYETVLVLGQEHMSSRITGAIPPDLGDPEGRSGLALPGVYAMAASRYMARYGLTLRQLAQVSVKNHGHALGNSRAQYSGDYTVEEVLASPLIADPLTLLQCCPISDGAAALVVGRAAARRDAVRVRSCALRSGRAWGYRSEHAWGFEIVRETAEAAYAEAGLGASEADLFEVHDSFTIGEILSIEGLGLAAEGEGGRLTESGHTALGGPQPVNPSGGLLSRGHPLGCTGVAQLAEVTWQLRGQAGARQVEGARIGVVETMGGGVAGLDGNACVVAVLERP